MAQLCGLINRKLFVTCFKSKRVLSYLYVTGDRAREIYSSIQPYIDFDKRLEDINLLDNNLKKRNLNVDVNELKKLWDFYKTRLDQKHRLETNRKEIKLSLEKLLSDNVSGSNDNEIDSLKLKFRLVRDDLKNITKTIWDIENNVVLKVLQIPNELHSRVSSEEVVLGVFNNKPYVGEDHLEAGKSFNCLEYIDKSAYYLKNELAIFEIIASQYFSDHFKNLEFVPTCNADFGRSVLIEGCTLKSFAPDVAFVLKNKSEDIKDNVYLTGGASFLPFYGFHTKQIVIDSQKPVRYITAGRQYNPQINNHFNGLYSVWQSNAVELFISVVDKNELMSEFDVAVQNVTDIYETLNVHFRVVNLPAHELKPWESLRTSFQLYSPVNKTYIEAGHISLIGDFISKRLQAHSVNTDGKFSYSNVISGTVIRLSVLMGHLLEYSDKNELLIPKVIKERMNLIQ